MSEELLRKIVRCIRRIEFGDGARYVGDAGRAIGPFQYHPEAFWDWADKPTAGSTWETWFTETLMGFLRELFEAYPMMPPEEAAIVFHRHHYITRMKPGDVTADNYLDRFLHAWKEDQA